MKTFFAIIALFLTAALPVLAQAEMDQPLGIPTPEGATVVTEIGITQDQLQGQLDALLYAFLSGGSFPEIDVERLKSALAPLESVQFVEMNVKDGYSPAGVLATFQKEVAGRRLIYDTGRKPGSGTIVMATSDGYFGAVVDEAESGSTKKGRIRAIRTVGFPDVRELAAMIADMGVLNLITSRM